MKDALGNLVLLVVFSVMGLGVIALMTRLDSQNEAQVHSSKPCWDHDLTYYVDDRVHLCFAGCAQQGPPARFPVLCTPEVLHLARTSSVS